jgi:hypothetical protein
MPKVFISAGAVATPMQQQAIEIVASCLEDAGLSPRRMGVNEWSHDQPLRAIRKVIRECDGIAVIAFERVRFPNGIEHTKQGDKSLADRRLPTVWNHIEAAIGYANDLPLLVIAENGLGEQGVLESMYDWNVYWTDFSPTDFRSEKFKGWLQSWKAAVLTHAARTLRSSAATDVDVCKLTVGDLLKRLTLPQLWGLLSALTGLLIAVASVSYRIGASKWPWQ